MAMKRPLVAAFAILACLMFAWATGAGRPYPASAGGVIDPSCSSSSPCIEYDNNGTGSGIKSLSVSGNGFNGTTQVHSTSTTNGRAGVFGNDVGTGSFNSGVHGQSVQGTGVSGSSTSGIGVQGVSSSANGVRGLSNTSDAVQGTIGSGVASSFHAGVAGLDRSTSGATNQGVYGDTTFGIGVQGVSLGSGIGVLGTSGDGVGVNAVGGRISGLHLPALSVVGNQSGPDLIDACPTGTANPCDEEHAVFRFISNGNLFIAGQIFTAGSCSTGCATRSGEVRARVTSYTPRESLPTTEDFGEARLVDGQAYVRLKPDFANIIDQHADYLVVVTPEGPSRGLYVTLKSPAGFAVMENPGGHSTLAFSYRIMAKPYGVAAARLPMTRVPDRTTLPRSRHADGRQPNL